MSFKFQSRVIPSLPHDMGTIKRNKSTGHKGLPGSEDKSEGTQRKKVIEEETVTGKTLSCKISFNI